MRPRYLLRHIHYSAIIFRPVKSRGLSRSLPGAAFSARALRILSAGFVIDYVASLDTVDIPFIGQLRAWQLAFIVVGLPGILLALLVMTLREPARRGLLGDEQGAAPKGIPIKVIIEFLRKNRRTYGHHLIGVSMFVMLAYAILAWTPAFFIRKLWLDAG